MASKSPYDVAEVVHFSTNNYVDSRSWSNAVNEHIKKFGYKVLHIGTESNFDHEGRPFQCTVAVLGK